MTEIYLHFLFAHYGLYGNAPVVAPNPEKPPDDTPKRPELELLVAGAAAPGVSLGLPKAAALDEAAAEKPLKLPPVASKAAKVASAAAVVAVAPAAAGKLKENGFAGAVSPPPEDEDEASHPSFSRAAMASITCEICEPKTIMHMRAK